MNNNRRQRNRGFTLLELLVAMAIFAVVSALALGGLNAVGTQQELARQDMEELADLQRAVYLLTWDLGQVYPRPVRDELGQDKERSLLTDGRQDFIVRVTRGGWRNPANFQRGTLQRVQYRIEDRELIREYWPVLDHPLGMEPNGETLLEDVEDVLIEYLDQEGQWTDQWPPLRAIGQESVAQPRAARITLTLDGWGEIQRLVEMLP
ncbi:MAG: type II secretion system minor pseudopilin GspJ [Gammaproteobacteria bacterium]|nr:type II secretion system minor pseudopilin GspJ [Gammaproteobacteria bacterium]